MTEIGIRLMHIVLIQNLIKPNLDQILFKEMIAIVERLAKQIWLSKAWFYYDTKTTRF